jgi:hypothetical protein
MIVGVTISSDDYRDRFDMNTVFVSAVELTESIILISVKSSDDCILPGYELTERHPIFSIGK